MEQPCKWCKKPIHILQISDGSWKPFEDPSGNHLHKCEEYRKQFQPQQKVIPLEELAEGHTKLFSKIIQRIEDLEKWRDSHEQSPN